LILSKPNHIKIYGHRGARGDLPENTLESFKYLFDNNFSGLEVDILFSKDLVPVITHDFFLDKDQTKDIEGNWIEDEYIKINSKTYKELLNYDVGAVNKLSNYGRRFLNQKSLENQRIPNLNKLFELLKSYETEDLIINLEFKSSPLISNLVPEPNEIVKLVKQEIEVSNLSNRILVSSFDWRVLKEFKLQLPKISRGYLSTQQELKKTRKNIYENSPWMGFIPFFNNSEIPEIINNLGGIAWHPFYKDIKKNNIEEAHNQGLVVNTWTVNRESDMMRMIEYGADGIFTDYPLRLKELCEKENIKWF